MNYDFNNYNINTNILDRNFSGSFEMFNCMDIGNFSQNSLRLMSDLKFDCNST